MGDILHHTIIVTGSHNNDDNVHWAKVARLKALKFFGGELVSELVDSGTNGVKSFFIAPDGSKESWERSDEGDDDRDRFIGWLKKCEYDDSSSPLAWAEVRYGDEYGAVTKITRCQ